MKGQELLKIAFTKLYEEIDDVTYDCEDIFTKLCASGLISEKSFRKIGNKLETFEKNRYGVFGDLVFVDRMVTVVNAW